VTEPNVDASPKRFAGRRVAVTGAASGIGRAVACAFGREGATVGCLDLDAAALAETVSQIGAPPGHVVSLTVDVSSSEQVERAMSDLERRLGGIDVLFTCAGGATLGSVHELSDDAWERSLAVNLTGTFYCCRAVVPGMLERGAGSIVLMASSLADGAPGFAAYSAAKAGVRALAAQMARDYGPTIRVNSVSPAAVDTPGLRRHFDAAEDPRAMEVAVAAANKVMHRLGTVDEVAAVVTFAASDAASFVTGQDLVVCGGQRVGAY
jgi:2-hydroxycyclohexanecarboxyl-CoA dehydrogenase